MKFTRLLLLSAFVLSGLITFSQGKLSSDRFLTRIANNQLLEGVRTYEAEGSPYLQDEFIMGDIYANDGRARGILLRYNIYEDYIEFKQGEAVYILRAEKSVDKVFIGVSKFVVEEYSYKGKSKTGYLQQLDSGKISLYVRKGVSLSQPQEPSAMNYKITPAKFSRTPDILYYRIGNGELLKIENMKKFLASLPERAEESRNFVDKRGISIKSETELLEFFKFYNAF